MKPFEAWAGPRDASLVIVGEAWGRSEAELRRPFVGAAGQELFQQLGEAFPEVAPDLHAEIVGLFRYGLAWSRRRDDWLHAAGIALTNVFNLQPLGNKIESISCKKGDLPKGYDWPDVERGWYIRPEFLGHVERLAEELRQVRPRLVVAAGGKATWALLRDTKISSIRGGMTQEILTGLRLKLLPTYHPAYVLRQWASRPITVADLMKAARERDFAEFRRPSRDILYSPTLVEATEWVDRVLAQRPALLACDTETARGQITMISFAPSPREALVLPFWDRSRPGWSYWASPQEEIAAWDLAERLLTCGARLVWQNGLYDIQYLHPLGLPALVDEDTMLRHHSILPEMLKGLGFLGSVYTSEPSWKLMRTEHRDTEKRDE